MVILNNQQYEITKEMLERFKDSLAWLTEEHIKQFHLDKDPFILKAQREGLQSQVDDFQRQIDEWINLKNQIGN
jgi:hypothetical protein